MAIAPIQAVSIGLVHMILMIFWVWEPGFPACGSNCLLQISLWKWRRNCWKKNHCAECLR